MLAITGCWLSTVLPAFGESVCLVAFLNADLNVERHITLTFTSSDGIGAKPGDYYPEADRTEDDAQNARIYDAVNNDVYQAGFGTTQASYEEALVPQFEPLDWLEERLTKQRYLMGEYQAEADWRLWTTLLRFDPVYVGLGRDFYQQPCISDTVDISYIKRHYYGSHHIVNPTGVVPMGPVIDYSARHDRAKFGKDTAE